MPINRFYISRLPEGSQDLFSIINNLLIPNLNRVFEDIERIESRVTGQEGNTATIHSVLDMQGQRVTNAARSAGPDDYVTRRELQELGIYNPNPGRSLQVKQLNVQTTLTLGGQVVPTVQQVYSLINQLIGLEVPAIRDGQNVDFADIDGTLGETRGILLFGVGPNNKARLIRVNSGGAIVSEDPKTAELIELLLQVLHKLNRLIGEDE